MFKIDAHLDLAMNAMEWNRDLCRPISEIRSREANQNDKPDRGKGTVNFEALRKGNIGLVVATQIARSVDKNNPIPGWHSPEQAWAQTQGQLAWYNAMEDKGELIMIRNKNELDAHIQIWNGTITNTELPIGYILSLEGADSLISPYDVEKAFNYGLRAIGPAHYGPGRYANGTNASGHLNEMGKTLLKEMARFKMILDVSHLCDDSFWDSLDLYEGSVWASHNNCRSIVPHNRQFSDEQIKVLIERNSVIGAALDAWMIVPDWVRGVSTPMDTNCNLAALVRHIDHICQLAGNSLHIGIGSDLDGAFGKEQCPYDIETIADIDRLGIELMKIGYQQGDVDNLYSGNWLRILNQAWA